MLLPQTRLLGIVVLCLCWVTFAASAQDDEEVSMAFRVGIIGCGRMASTIEDEQIAKRKQGPYRSGIVLPYCHAGGYALVEETRMVAACDIAEDKLKTFCERWNVPRGYTDFRELIDTEKPDILSMVVRYM